MVEEGAEKISALFSNVPFFVGRNGTIEIEAIYFWLLKRRGGGDTPYPERIREPLQRNAGVFPDTDESFDAWCEAYTQSLIHLDGVAAGWYKPLQHIETMILSRYATNVSFQCPLRSIEPYYVGPERQWTRKLSGKKVAVVSSFAETIQKQLWGERTPQIWTGAQEGLLPGDVDWVFVKTGYAPTLALGRGDWPTERTWQDAANNVIKAVLESGATIALIGCGGLGMIIGGELRARGVSVIVMGGAIQVLFGIKGRRWATHDVISKFWNSAWMWPMESEIPKGARLVEGACYWN